MNAPGIGGRFNILHPINYRSRLNTSLLEWHLCIRPYQSTGAWPDLRQRNYGTLHAGAFSGIVRPGGLGLPLLFNGTSGYWSSINDIPSSGGWTIAAWNLQIVSATITVIIDARDASGHGTLLYFDDSINKFTLFFYDGTTVSTATSANTYNDQKWHHIVGTYDGAGTGKVYVDGVLGGTATGITYTTTSTQMVMAGDYTGGFYHQSNDDLRLYSRALSATEVNALYNESRRSYPNALSRATPALSAVLAPFTAVQYDTMPPGMLRPWTASPY